MLPSDWSLKDELLALLQRWYLVAAAALVGGLVGWLSAFLIPPVNEAEVSLTVTFNNDAVFLNPDDYKNGQLAELSDFVLSEEVLQLTLDQLQRMDVNAFSAWTVRDLREMVEPRWRNVGAWQLAVQHEESGVAGVVAAVWAETVLQETAGAIASAAEFNEIDRRLTAQARGLEAVRMDHAVFIVMLRDLETWLETYAGDGQVAELLHLGSRMAHLEPRSPAAVLPIVEEEALTADPVRWAQTAAEGLREEIAFLEDLLIELQTAYDGLGEEWLLKRTESRGLSAYLQVEVKDTLVAKHTRLYRQGDLILAGALVGVLVLVGVRFGRIVFREA